MSWLDEIRPIRLFSLYLALIFIVSTALRWRQYHAILSLVTRLRSRWPNLTQLVLTHRHIFFTWRTWLPLILTLMILLANFIANHYIWPTAGDYTVANLWDIWPMLWPITIFCSGMLTVDLWGTLRVGVIDLKQTEEYFDLAEKWLTGWRAPVVRWLSLGYINPRQMVNDQVRDALLEGSRLLHTNLWWIIAQTLWRIAFALSMWTSFIFHDWILALLP